jgi:hypothetical protein
MQLKQRRIHVTIAFATQGWISQKKYLKANGHPLSDVMYMKFDFVHELF